MCSDKMSGRESRGLDDPPNSRLFILCQKGTTEQEFRDSFDQYGTIEDIWIIKDKRTNEDRGIAYIKFSKTSEAMQAMEEMNGKALPGSTKGLKVVVANSKRDGSTRDPREDERLVRLFVIIPKSFNEQNLQDEFSKFGDVENVTVLKDRSSGENKGFGYVRFFRPIHAALAYENCDSSYRPKFAEPQRSRDERDEIENHGYTGAGQKRMYEEDFGGFHGNYNMDSTGFQGFRPGSNSGGPGPREMLADYSTTSSTSRLVIQAPIGLTQGYLVKLFSLIPGMEYCDLNETTGIAYARYSSPQCAAYARDKLHGFEYPLGSALHVQLAEDSARQEYPMNVDSGYASGYGNSQFGNYGQSSFGLDSMDVRQKAAMILEKAGINPQNLLNLSSASSSGLGSVGDGRKERVLYCNVSLPPPQPTVQDDGKNLAQRLFIVCQPSGVSERVLKDAFCRFGNLIDVYLLSGRNYGYAKYASKESAMKAIDTLHGQSLGGQKIKVLEAEPPKAHQGHQGLQGDEGPSKKQRL
ncbi:RNA-binding protein 45 [Aplysia californica]|uniref:RNA-binding protein 45 n=1 Tax=Aplysia californica TaxID=6500 RepID=A0ABM0JWH6_APLCA|nr:RNA-binding protein 45 [Aplysia californica]